MRYRLAEMLHRLADWMSPPDEDEDRPLHIRMDGVELEDLPQHRPIEDSGGFGDGCFPYDVPNRGDIEPAYEETTWGTYL